QAGGRSLAARRAGHLLPSVDEGPEGIGADRHLPRASQRRSDPSLVGRGSARLPDDDGDDPTGRRGAAVVGSRRAHRQGPARLNALTCPGWTRRRFAIRTVSTCSTGTGHALTRPASSWWRTARRSTPVATTASHAR